MLIIPAARPTCFRSSPPKIRAETKATPTASRTRTRSVHNSGMKKNKNWSGYQATNQKAITLPAAKIMPRFWNPVVNEITITDTSAPPRAIPIGPSEGCANQPISNKPCRAAKVASEAIDRTFTLRLPSPPTTPIQKAPEASAIKITPHSGTSGLYKN